MSKIKIAQSGERYDIAKRACMECWPDEETRDILSILDFKLVWYSKTLQNWKAILATFFPARYLFEVLYNGIADEIYVDCWEKKSNTVIKE